MRKSVKRSRDKSIDELNAALDAVQKDREKRFKELEELFDRKEERILTALRRKEEKLEKPALEGAIRRMIDGGEASDRLEAMRILCAG